MKGLTILFALAALGQTGENPVFEQLTKEGVVTADGSVALLPPPLMADNLSAAEQRKVIDSISEGNKNFESLTKKQVVAPYVMKISDVKPTRGDSKTIRQVDIYYVIHTDLKRLEDESFLKAQTEDREKNDEETKISGSELTPEVLAAKGIQVAEGKDRPERYYQGSIPLFGRVRVEGTGRSFYTRSENSALLASILDPRFADDEKLAGRWIPLTRNEKTGKLETGEPQPYSGAGAYTKATVLLEPAGALFVEQHIVFDEPQGWFRGANLLRSKLPIVVQDEIRLLRRRAMAEPKSDAKR